MKPRIAFVVQRYGIEVNGGAEFLCRRVAELMNTSWNLDVLTTCALDYMTWTNHYPQGETRINGVKVIRFPVKRERNIQAFNKISEKVFRHPHSHEDELEWMAAQGPDAPQLIRYILENRQRYDLFVFVTYLYGTTFWCLPLVADKAFLIPAAHDEPPIYLSIFDYLFKKPEGFIFSTPEEKAFVVKRFGIAGGCSDVIGVGIETISNTPEITSEPLPLPKEYVIYVGRIDESKGCGQLFNYWDRYKNKNRGEMKLVLVGGSQMQIPPKEDLLHLGFISETDKYNAISNAKCMIMPSLYESFSIVLLESWMQGRPVLVNGHCDVLKGQCRRANGGLWYLDYREFEACLDFLLHHDDLAAAMASNGKRYVIYNYDLAVIRRKYTEMINNYLSRSNSPGISIE